MRDLKLQLRMKTYVIKAFIKTPHNTGNCGRYSKRINLVKKEKEKERWKEKMNLHIIYFYYIINHSNSMTEDLSNFLP